MPFEPDVLQLKKGIAGGASLPSGWFTKGSKRALSPCCCRVNRVNPLLQATKFMYEHNPTEVPITKPRRCGAKTRSGAACAKYPIAGKRRCRLHGGLSSGPKTAAGRARIAAANTKYGRFVGWRAHGKREKYYFAEIRRLLAKAKAAGLIPKD